MITLFIVTLGSMLVVTLGESRYANFSAKRFLYNYAILWLSVLFTLAVVSVLWFTSYTDEVYYAKTINKDTYLKITTRQYTTKLMGEDSLSYSPPKQVSVKRVSSGVYRYETGKWKF